MSNLDHLMIDGYSGDESLMQDPMIVRELILDIAQQAGTILQEPYIIPYFNGKVPEDCGVTATALIDEGGHLAIHTFSKKGTIFVDIATPNDLSNEIKTKIQEQIGRTFDIPEFHQFTRGTKLDSIPQCFGPHFMADGNLSKQLTLEELYDLIDTIPTMIEMTPISKPHVVKRSNGGLTGIEIIAESHIAIHQESNGDFHFDIFSCKPFDIETLKKYLTHKGIPLINTSLIARGLKFPR